MSFTKQTSATLQVNNTTISDGCFITLNVGNNYINSQKYSFSTNLTTQNPVWSFDDHSPTKAYTSYEDITAVYGPGDHMVSSPSQISYYAGTNSIGNDVMAAPNFATVSRHYRTYNGATPPPGDLLGAPNIDTTFPLNNVSTNNAINLCVEIHGTYIVLRGLNGLYMHNLPSEQVKSTTYSAPVETVSDYVLTFSNLPSALHSAQWSLYTQSNTNSVVLLNRASNTCLTMSGSTLDTGYTTWQWTGSAPYNWMYKIAATWYNNATTQQCYFNDTYTQPIYRVLGVTPLASAISSSACIFTLNVITQTTCDIRNPNANCQNANNYVLPGVPSAFVNLCGNGDMMSTNNCQSWALGVGLADAQSTVAAYCAANQNDQIFCGCISLWGVRELEDFLSYNSPPFQLNPNCNVPTCLPNKSYRSPSAIANTCVQQLCSQTLLVLGSILSSDVTFKATCSNTATVNSGGTVATNGVIAEIFSEIQAYAVATYNNCVTYIQNATTKLNLISVVISIIVTVLLVFIMVIVFKLSLFLIPVMLAIGSVSIFLLFFNQ